MGYVTSPKTNMTGWKPTIFHRKQSSSNGWFSILILVFWLINISLHSKFPEIFVVKIQGTFLLQALM